MNLRTDIGEYFGSGSLATRSEPSILRTSCLTRAAGSSLCCWVGSLPSVGEIMAFVDGALATLDATDVFGHWKAFVFGELLDDPGAEIQPFLGGNGIVEIVVIIRKAYVCDFALSEAATGFRHAPNVALSCGKLNELSAGGVSRRCMFPSFLFEPLQQKVQPIPETGQTGRKKFKQFS